MQMQREACMERYAIYAGSFDPMTNGHIEVLRASFSVAERITIAVGLHSDKQFFFTLKERLELIDSVSKEVFFDKADRLDIITFDNLLVDKAKEIGACLLIRGLRDGSDLDYEMRLAEMNRLLAPNIQTVFLLAPPSVKMISATLVRQIAAMHGDVSHFVPEGIVSALNKKYNSFL
ncbi:MAG: pantetheine-phosphate adenylyltransferase [Candidatus Tokpelaia sp. JSC161]|jgi:pantetheine-phosphate adenylyltransferase|nr:MAG: pantetheine-phosphate adenylyltransferase [Candidatus Tokpelaia sp. JSC161]